MKLSDHGLELLSTDSVNDVGQNQRRRSARTPESRGHDLGLSVSVDELPKNREVAADVSPWGSEVRHQTRMSQFTAAASARRRHMCSCLLRQRVIVVLLTVGLTTGFAIIVASLVVYGLRLSAETSDTDAFASTENTTGFTANPSQSTTKPTEKAFIVDGERQKVRNQVQKQVFTSVSSLNERGDSHLLVNVRDELDAASFSTVATPSDVGRGNSKGGKRRKPSKLVPVPTASAPALKPTKSPIQTTSSTTAATTRWLTEQPQPTTQSTTTSSHFEGWSDADTVEISNSIEQRKATTSDVSLTSTTTTVTTTTTTMTTTTLEPATVTPVTCAPNDIACQRQRLPQIADNGTCPTGYFKCDNGTSIDRRIGSSLPFCIPEDERCDRVRDCLDASDEQNCTYECANQSYFRCERGAIARWPFAGFCVRPEERCNGKLDCRDGSDETGCEPITKPETTMTTMMVPRCAADEWSCADAAACLPLAFRCDRRRHCADGSDEMNCDFRCPSGSFPCRTGSLAADHGSGLCVAARAACDGIRHCADGSDEEGCNATCADGYFRCHAGAHVINRQPCVPEEYVCDREQDCADGSDEPPTCNVTCPEHQVACKTGLIARWPYSGYCVDLGDLCDGVNDCQDASDETNCDLANKTLAATNQNMSTCSAANKWACPVTSLDIEFLLSAAEGDTMKGASEVLCINVSSLCDGWADCPDGSDEINCTAHVGNEEICPVDHWRCSKPSGGNFTSAVNGSSGNFSYCVPSSARCDDKVDCWDGSDEIGCNRSKTAATNCLSNFFRCANGTRIYDNPASSMTSCIPFRFRCDRRVDCSDSSDESGCVYNCPDDHVSCTSGTLSRWPWRGFCLPQSRLCDGRRDCSDGSDETGCSGLSRRGRLTMTSLGCASGQFRCHSDVAENFGGKSRRVCISGRLRCDGYADCADGSDELACEICPPGKFLCRQASAGPHPGTAAATYCIDAALRCDGKYHCADASDEAGCNTTTKTMVVHEGTSGPPSSCDGFLCARDFRCIPRRWTCDRELDCADGSDELNCTYRCADGQIACQSGTLNHRLSDGYCYHISGRCDGVFDCKDGSDEKDCEQQAVAVSSMQLTPVSRPCPAPTDLRCRSPSAPGNENLDNNVEDKDVCVAANFRCDRVADCADAADERGCIFQCPDSFVACTTGVVKAWPHRGFCISASLRCNDSTDCVDGSDEAHCSENANGLSPTHNV